MDQIVVHQKRKVGNAWQWKDLDLFSEAPFRCVTACTWKCTLMADDYVSISFVSHEYVDFAVGDWCVINGRYYSIRSMSDVSREGEEEWTYNVVMYGVMYDLIKCMFRNCDQYGRSSTSYFDLTYTLEEFIKVIVYNMNRDAASGSEEWEWGNSAATTPWPDTDPITISFQRSNCLTALQNICKQFDYEFRVSQRWEDGTCIKTITVGKFSKTPQNSTPFAYGQGDGLYKLKECKVDDSTIVTRLWVEGGQENVRSSYRNYAQFLQLPLRRKNRYHHDFDDGSSVEPNTDWIGITDDGKRYIEDSDLIARYGVIEDSYQTDEIYPHFTGTIHSIGSSWSGGNGRLQFRANIGFDLNAKWAKEFTPNFNSDYAEWCYINGYYSHNLENYERYCLLHGYTDEYHQYLTDHGYTEEQLPFSGWWELIMNGYILPVPATYTAFDLEVGNAINTYRSISESTTANTKYLIDSSTCAKIAFITGKLAGQTFDVSAFTQKTIAGTTYGQFTINENTEEDTGTVMPSPDATPGQPFRFAVGDKFKIIDIFLPYEYYVQAEEELWYSGREKFEDVKQASYKYDLTFEKTFVEENETALMALLPGQYIKVYDERFFSSINNHTKAMRISGIDIDLLNYSNFKLTLDSVHKLKRRHIGNNIFDIDDIINDHAIRALDYGMGEDGGRGRGYLNPGHSYSPGNNSRRIFGGGTVIRPDIIGDEAIAERMLASNSVTASKIKDGQVAQSKLATALASKIDRSAEGVSQLRWFRDHANNGSTSDRHYSGAVDMVNGKVLMLKQLSVTDSLSMDILGHGTNVWSNANNVEIDFSDKIYEAGRAYTVYAQLASNGTMTYKAIDSLVTDIPDDLLKVCEVSKVDGNNQRSCTMAIGKSYMSAGVIRDGANRVVLDIMEGLLKDRNGATLLSLAEGLIASGVKILRNNNYTTLLDEINSARTIRSILAGSESGTLTPFKKMVEGSPVSVSLQELLGELPDSAGGLRKQVSEKLNTADVSIVDDNGTKRLVIGTTGIAFGADGKISVKNSQGTYVTLFGGAKIENGTITIGEQSLTPTSDSNLFVHTNDAAWTQLVAKMNVLVNVFDGMHVQVCNDQQCFDRTINFNVNNS